MQTIKPAAAAKQLLLIAIASVLLLANYAVQRSQPPAAGGEAALPAGQASVRLEGWQQQPDGSWQLWVTLHALADGRPPALYTADAQLTLAAGQLQVTAAGAAGLALPGAAVPVPPAALGARVQLLARSLHAPAVWLVDLAQWPALACLQLVLQAAAIAALLVLWLFCFSLWYHKRQRTLLYFMAYLLLLFGWGLLSMAAAPAGWLLWQLERVLYSLTLLANFWLTLSLTGTAVLPGRPVRRRTVAAASLGAMAFSLLLPERPRFVLIELVTLYIFGLLLDAVRRGLPGVWPMALGGAATTGLRLSVTLLQRIPEPLPSYLLRACRIYDLPFALGCMYFVCRQFAIRFGRTEALAQELDRRVAQRTQALAQQTEARKSLMLNIFHDLRSPLFAISSGLAQLQQTPQALPALLPVLRQRSQFLCALTEDLFLAAKLEQHQLMLNEDRADLGEAAAQVAGAMAAEAQSKGVQLTFSRQGPLPVWGDAVRLQQALQNLVANAIHYTPTGGQVTVRCYAKGGTALCAVQDTGCGIPPEEQGAVFRRYFHTAAPGARHDSTGLGLTIADELVRLHRGEIRLQSEVGRGSCFTVCLPLLPDGQP